MIGICIFKEEDKGKRRAGVERTGKILLMCMYAHMEHETLCYAMDSQEPRGLSVGKSYTY